MKKSKLAFVLVSLAFGSTVNSQVSVNSNGIPGAATDYVG